jgi:hypothetical protein
MKPNTRKDSLQAKVLWTERQQKAVSSLSHPSWLQATGIRRRIRGKVQNLNVSQRRGSLGPVLVSSQSEIARFEGLSTSVVGCDCLRSDGVPKEMESGRNGVAYVNKTAGRVAQLVTS